MKRIVLLSLSLMFLFSSCRFIGGRHIRGNGNVTTRERTTGSFQQVEVSGALEVYVRQDSAQKPVRVETDENLQDFVEVSESNGTLYIGTVENANLDPTRGVKIYVSSPGYRGLRVSGASTLKSENKLMLNEQLDLDLSGASEMKLSVKSPKVVAEVSGASGLEIAGETRDARLNGSGASHFRCYDLMSENTSVDISGACSAEVFASVKLDIQASGASEIRYKGAASLSQDVSGASSIRKVD
jgi:hypothetical protein